MTVKSDFVVFDEVVTNVKNKLPLTLSGKAITSLQKPIIIAAD